MKYFEAKSIGEKQEYTNDWSAELATNETIGTSVWSFFGGSGELQYLVPYDGQSANYTLGETVTGGTSGATGTVILDDDQGASGTLCLSNVVGAFEDNETLTGSATGIATSQLDGRISGTKTTMWVAAGTGGEEYECKNKITTSGGRTYEKTGNLAITQD